MSWFDRIVPFSVEFVASETETFEFLVCDRNAGFVLARIECGPNNEARLCRGACNRVAGAEELADSGRQTAGAAADPAVEHCLLDALGNDQFDVDHIDSIDSATTNGHLEFRVQYRNRRRIPVPSRN